MSIDYSENHGSPTSETIGIGQPLEARRVLICPWASRLDLVVELANKTYPHMPQAGAIATSFIIKPAPGQQLGTGQMTDYENAEVEVIYGPPPSGTIGDDPGGEWISESVEPSAEYISTAYKDFKWSVNSKPLVEKEAPGMLIAGMTYSRTLHNIAAIGQNVISLVNHVNDRPLYAATPGWNFRFPTETLLYSQPSFSRSLSVTGQGLWTVTLRFIYKASGWNKFWCAEAQAFSRIKKPDGTLYYQYPLANLLLLG